MLPKSFKPMLSGKAGDLSEIKGTQLCSPKLDGIRCVILEGKALTRNLKEVPNKHIRSELFKTGVTFLDGELIVGAPTGNDVMNRTASGVMSADGEPDWTYFVFDYLRVPELSFEWRYNDACRLVNNLRHPRIKIVPHEYLAFDQLQSYADRMLAKGYEGIMLRSPNAPYKFGRSTAKEGGLLKYKMFADREATIVGFVEQMHNANEQTRDELGRAKRSKRKAGMVATGKLGALVCELDKTTTRFEIGTGLTDSQRIEMWRNRKALIGKQVTFTYQDFTPAGVPRFPSFKAVRLDA